MGDRGIRIAPVAVAVLGCLLLADCAASNKYAGGEPQPSPRVVAPGEPVPKGGGNYRVGKPYMVAGRAYFPSADPRYTAEGTASWYGADFHGRLTANGEVFDMHSLSAAHPTMPMPSYARVTNLDNGRSIIVRVNDRGPYAQNRVIDVSIAAAKALEFYGRGLAHVRVEYVGRAPLEGTDDRMLMATLRQGTPAPAPSRVLVASAGPFVPGFGEADDSGPLPLPAERPFSLGGGPVASPQAGTGPAKQVRSAVRLPTPAVPARSPDLVAAAPISAYAPVSGDGSAGLLSGRGLY
jgi:peptidoglycan lytic transglycosylase